MKLLAPTTSLFSVTYFCSQYFQPGSFLDRQNGRKNSGTRKNSPRVSLNDVNCSLVGTSLLSKSGHQTGRNINRTPLAILARQNYKVASIGNNQLLNEFGHQTGRNINRTPLAILARQNYKVASIGNNQLLNELGQKKIFFR